ncbi:MAG TPA: DUF983 domain-containing protein [Candidatus Limnocylindrales bacterium]|nr:DUF983 domain-containing protein [Candidatus Limnocylindrales bacterium]
MTPEPASSPPLVPTLMKGLRRRCPRCGEGRLYHGWMTLRETCDVCGLHFQRESGDTWAFVYLSTAGMTGVVVIAMLLVQPDNLLVGNTLLILGATAAIVLTLPYRKGVAVALSYWLDPPQ